MAQPKPLILLIDDELQWQKYFVEHFSSEFTFIYVRDVMSGLTVLKTNPEIRVVILDVSIKPDQKVSSFTGLDIIHQIREQRPDIPIIIYTAYPLNRAIPASYLKVDAIFTRQEVFHNDLLLKRLRQLIHKEDQNSHQRPLSLSDVQKLFDEQYQKISTVKERVLSIPEEGNYELIKPLVGFKKDIERQLSKYDYSRNVFLMMKFRDSNKDLSDYIIENLENNGLKGIRADQNAWNITHNVYNPIAVLYCCKYGIALFDEAEDHQAYSPNVAYELGIMHLQHKNCLILKHNSLPAIPFDLIKDLYSSYNKELEVRKLISNWIIQIRHSWGRDKDTYPAL